MCKMKTRIVTDYIVDIENIDDLIYIDEKYLDKYLEIELEEDEAYELVEEIIKEDTQIDLLAYDINFIDSKTITKMLKENFDEDDKEASYIKKTLIEKYSNGVMNDPIEYVMNSICRLEERYVEEILENTKLNMKIYVDYNKSIKESKLIKLIYRLFK